MGVTAKIPEGMDLKRWVLAHVPELGLDETVVFREHSYADDTVHIVVGWSNRHGDKFTHQLVAVARELYFYDIDIPPEDIVALRVKAKMSLCL